MTAVITATARTGITGIITSPLRITDFLAA